MQSPSFLFLQFFWLLLSISSRKSSTKSMKAQLRGSRSHCADARDNATPLTLSGTALHETIHQSIYCTVAADRGCDRPRGSAETGDTLFHALRAWIDVMHFPTVRHETGGIRQWINSKTKSRMDTTAFPAQDVTVRPRLLLTDGCREEILCSAA